MVKKGWLTDEEMKPASQDTDHLESTLLPRQLYEHKHNFTTKTGTDAIKDIRDYFVFTKVGRMVKAMTFNRLIPLLEFFRVRGSLFAFRSLFWSEEK